jgi:diaminopimelate decarboxylase/aspartate kinase
MNSWIVVKFGGTSVSSRERWDNISQIINTHHQQGKRVIVVCSALSKISRLLKQLVHDATVESNLDIFDTIKARYFELGKELGVDAQSILKDDFKQLQQLISGVQLLQEASSRTQAQILSFGEMMLTKLGHEFLQSQGVDNSWLDIRDGLKSVSDSQQHTKKHYLAALCDASADSNFAQKIDSLNADVIITQGFVASDEQGDTVLLGWGGSDISAAYIAAKIQAEYCEIWTDVPGVYTANPHQIPQARLIKQLDYEEAKEIAAMGAKVLHPNTIPPLSAANIPLRIKYTPNPQHEGSLITHESEEKGLSIKSILTKYHITVITIETMSMWRQSGFLADVFTCFKHHDLSIDLVATSESSVTVTLDNEGQVIDDQRIHALLKDLNQFSQASLITPCAQVTLVGRNIRSILHCFGPVFEVFESQKIYLLSQSANDLNLSFIVNEDQAERIARKLHTLLIDHNPESYYYSKSWQEEFTELKALEKPWWQEKRDKLLQLAHQSSPCYVYDNDQLVAAARQLTSCDVLDRIFFAMKANPNKKVLEVFYKEGLGFECVSVGEINLILSLFPDIDRKRILFTPNFAPKDEYQYAFEQGLYVTVDGVYPLNNWPEVFKGQSILLRIDPGVGLGHHRYVSTGGNASKFGIPQSELPNVVKQCQQHDINVIGLHAHYGSGILQADLWHQTAELLTGLLEYFPNVSIINLGGGLGIVERPGQRPLDTQELNQSLTSIKKEFPDLKFWIEPGRFLVARAGVILAKVTQLKQKSDTQFIGIETGMNSLIRPALYGSFHEIVNLQRFDQERNTIAHIVGPICESGDTLGFSRYLPKTEEGDVILIANTGAYGFAMGSRYNLREPAQECFVD